MIRKTIKERFETKYIPEPNTGCWLWIGAASPQGYGHIKLGYKDISAHRASWMIYNGEIPATLCVLHSCDTPSCVNPKHLFLGTHKENTRDMYAKKRQCKNIGRMRFDLKLNVKLAEEIRKDTRSLSKIAKDYNVSPSEISLVKNGIRWA